MALLGGFVLLGAAGCATAESSTESLIGLQGNTSELGTLLGSVEGGGLATSLRMSPAASGSLPEGVTSAKITVAVNCLDGEDVAIAVNDAPIGTVACEDTDPSGYVALTTTDPVDLTTSVGVTSEGGIGSKVGLTVYIEAS